MRTRTVREAIVGALGGALIIFGAVMTIPLWALWEPVESSYNILINEGFSPASNAAFNNIVGFSFGLLLVATIIAFGADLAWSNRRTPRLTVVVE